MHAGRGEAFVLISTRSSTRNDAVSQINEKAYWPQLEASECWLREQIASQVSPGLSCFSSY